MEGFCRLAGDALDLSSPMKFLTWNDKHKLHHASLNVPERVATGFSGQGALALRELARELRRANPTWETAVTLHQVEAKLASVLRTILEAAPETETGVAAAGVAQRLLDWTVDIGSTRRHAVPIAFLPQRATRFAIGPVEFVHREDFGQADVKVGASASNANSATERHQFAMERIDKSLATRGAHWIALVTVSNREADVSVATANNAVDIALGALQAMVGTSGLNTIGRVGGRLANWDCFDTWFEMDGQTAFRRNDDPPGFAIDIGAFEKWLAEAHPARSAAGQCLHAFLAGGPFPRLNEAWCEAAYWFHEAMAEHLDTMRIARLETSLEVLLRAEKSSGSANRILAGLEAVLGIDPSTNIGVVRSVTMRELVEEMVRSRSRVLHGTWPTLTSDLPGTIPVSDLAAVVRRLIVMFAIKLEQYAANGDHKDDLAPFLTWVRGQATKRASTVVSAETK